LLLGQYGDRNVVSKNGGWGLWQAGYEKAFFFLSQKDTELELELELELEIKPAKANVLRKQKALLRRDDH
jgi:hypothetical protein